MNAQPRNGVAGQPHVVIVGGGYAGLSAARMLRHAPVRVTVLDRTNHSVFFPLLYQVATGVLSPDEIAMPIRRLLRRQRNAAVRMTEVLGVDPSRRVVLTADGPLAFDYLVLATGVGTTYFGHSEWERHSLSLASIADAVAIRDRLLHAFERAELTTDPSEAQALLTIVLVGGGPTGVEMAGAIAELAHRGLADEFRRINPRAARIVLLEAGPRLLPTFPARLGLKARRALERMGVEVHTDTAVTEVTAAGVATRAERIASHTVIWAAGVAATPAARWLDVAADRGGRVKVAPDLSAPGHPSIFVVGDVAAVEQDGQRLPGVAQVAIQEGRYVGALIGRRVLGRVAPAQFRYRNFGNMATVGRGFAVADFGWFTSSGILTWLLWLLIHIVYLAGMHNRLQVVLQWASAYVAQERNVRLLSRDGVSDPQAALAPPPPELSAA